MLKPAAAWSVCPVLRYFYLGLLMVSFGFIRDVKTCCIESNERCFFLSKDSFEKIIKMYCKVNKKNIFAPQFFGV